MSTSPLLKRTNAEKLTKELLQKHITPVKNGLDAAEKLAKQKDTLTPEQIKNLKKVSQEGQKSQRELILSALPLIKNIASREFKRRKAWASRIDFDDILQEAIAGFIRGLKTYNPNSNYDNPSNYLGQWIQTSIRRRIEVMEHDFTIPYEVVERGRRIRAVRSRLINELEREPTDDEMLEALNEATGQYGSSRWGGKAQTSARKKNLFTEAHLREAENLVDRSYGLQQHDSVYESEEEQVERVAITLTAQEEDGNEAFEEQHVNMSRHEFFRKAFIAMKIGSKQQDIILRFFGMTPYSENQTQKDIVKQTGYPVRFVKLVILEFQSYMPVKGGIFHLLITDTSYEVIESLDLSWIIPLLGDFPADMKKAPVPAPEILTQQTTKVPKGLNNG